MTHTDETSITLSIRNVIEDLPLVTEALDRIGENLEIPKKAMIQLQVALDEVLSNIIKYAWPSGEDHTFDVHIRADQERVEIMVDDDGFPFDPRSHAPRAAPVHGVRPRPGGVGIKMTKQLVEGFDYARIGGRNQVTLTKKYTTQES